MILGMNPAVGRTLHELSVVKNIVEDNFVKDFEVALETGIDYIGEQFLGRDISPKEV